MIRKIFLEDALLRPFLFAGYRRITVPHVPVNDKKIYFEGDKYIELARSLHDGEGKDIIVFVEVNPQIPLETRAQIFMFLCNERGLRYSKQIFAKMEAEDDPLKHQKRMSEGEFREFVKMSLARRKWHKEVFKRKESAYHLFSTASQGLHTFIEALFKVEQDVPLPILFSSFLTFLSKVHNYDEIKDSIENKRYRIQVRRAHNMFENKIKGALSNLIEMDSELPLEARILSFFVGLRS